MNLQEKLLETTAGLRTRALALANTALTRARSRANQRVEAIKDSLAALTVAGRALNTVARLHTAQFVKKNSAIAVEAGRDVSALARTTYATLAKRGGIQAPKSRKTRTRKRVAAKAA